MEGVSRVRVQKVTRLFGATAALRGVSCSFEAGTLSFIRGPNGAGKSTLMAIVGTVLRPTSGQVLYDPFRGDRQRARTHIGWVSHDSHCYPDLTGRENVQLCADIYGVEREAVQAAGERVEVLRFFDQPVRTLSRGQKQRVALARALVHSPSVLLLDEPLSGLDADSSERFRAIVEQERDAGRIVVVISHRDAWVKRFSNARSIFMEAGRIVEKPRGSAS